MPAGSRSINEKNLMANAGKKRVKLVKIKRNRQNECLKRGKRLNGCRRSKLVRKTLEICCLEQPRWGLWWLDVYRASGL